MKYVATALISVVVTIGTVAVLNRIGFGRQVLGS